MSMLMLKVATPMILTFGILGNLVSYIIFTNEKMKHLPTFKFLSYLSLIDCLYILIGIPHIMAITFFNYDFRNTSNLICSVHSFLTIYLSHLSSNVLAAIGVFRCVKLTSSKLLNKKFYQNSNIRMRSINKTTDNVIYSPNRLSLRQKYFNSVHVIFLVILLILFVFDSHYLFFMRINLNTECYPEENHSYYDFYIHYWPWVDLLLYSYIPFIVMITSTIIIAYKLFKSSKSQIKRRRENALQISKLKPAAMSINHLGLRSQTKFKLNNQLIRRSKRNNQIYKLLITINITFFILVTPLVFTNSLKQLNKDYGSFFELVYISAYLNHCLNFLFYGLSCSQYRSILLEKLKCS